MPRVLVPMSPGTTSAMGLLVTDIKHDYSVALIRRVDGVDLGLVEEQFERMVSEGREALAREGVGGDEMRFVRQADVRYVGQSYELTISLPEGLMGENEVADVLKRFHAEHERAYGFMAEGEPVEFVALRLSAIGEISKPRVREIGESVGGADRAVKGSREVYFAESGGFVDCRVYDRYGLRSGDVVEGPGIVEEVDSTVVVHPGWVGVVDGFGNIWLCVDSSRV